VALLAFLLFKIPLIVCYCIAYVVSCISPSVMVPGIMALGEKGYGKKKGIISTMIAAGTFEDILCIILFAVCK
jgi:Kef-type K+ transport system membrane component KefB